ncbi:hypothetical protein K7X08_001861 [Anisodus acutangulus]|uniref:Uncharacterized protein n=1 Tax=Anisodus acutangulus TaxID=402998 RepID=A0A9Q1LQF7_9SOLA|nr:hypothetical protein K7X08_001861 [Anisodus acutangulus]
MLSPGGIGEAERVSSMGRRKSSDARSANYSSKQENPASISSSDSMEVMGSSRGNSFLHKCESFDRPFIQKWLKIGNRTVLHIFERSVMLHCHFMQPYEKRNLECFAALAIPVKTVEFAWSRVMPSSQPALLVGMQVHEGTDED